MPGTAEREVATGVVEAVEVGEVGVEVAVAKAEQAEEEGEGIGGGAVVAVYAGEEAMLTTDGRIRMIISSIPVQCG